MVTQSALYPLLGQSQGFTVSNWHTPRPALVLISFCLPSEGPLPYIAKGRGVEDYGQRYLGTSFYRTSRALRPNGRLLGRESHHHCLDCGCAWLDTAVTVSVA